MNELLDLYQDIILDHNKRPRNRGRVEEPTHEAEGYNPLCGDLVSLTLEVEDDGSISDIRFDGSGCAISTASASLLTDEIKGRTTAEARRLFDRFRDMLTGDPSAPAEVIDELGKLGALSGVRAYPMRVKCATLVWHTLQAALEKREAPVSTE